jgi:hypothetical protein
MLFESSHSAERTFVVEVRHTPLDRLFDIWTASMDNFAKAFENRLRERSGLRDVSINARIFASHAPDVNDRAK